MILLSQRNYKNLGRNGVPLYLLYGTKPGNQPAILPQVLTTDLVLQYLDEMD